MASVMLLNPAKRPKKRGSSVSAKKTKRKSSGSKTKKAMAKRASTTSRKRTTGKRRTYRRNPVGRMNVMDAVVPSLVGGGGALAVDIGLAYAPLPEKLKTGPVNFIVRGVASGAIGMLAAMFTDKKTAAQITSGALTVVAYDALKQGVQKMAPSIRLSEYGDDDDGLLEAYLDEYESPAMQLDAYLDGDDDGMIELADASFEDGGAFMSAYLDGEYEEIENDMDVDF